MIRTLAVFTLLAASHAALAQPQPDAQPPTGPDGARPTVVPIACTNDLIGQGDAIYVEADNRNTAYSVGLGEAAKSSKLTMSAWTGKFTVLRVTPNWTKTSICTSDFKSGTFSFFLPSTIAPGRLALALACAETFKRTTVPGSAGMTVYVSRGGLKRKGAGIEGAQMYGGGSQPLALFIDFRIDGSPLTNLICAHGY